jgi:hypothetical protein
VLRHAAVVEELPQRRIEILPVALEPEEEGEVVDPSMAIGLT